jgi:DNA-binding helix-hairpin-helix protein with protein kinase domain/Flp pilus assembly protein TadD
MPTYYDSTGRQINLTTILGRGGEGIVYAISGDDRFVGKIYHQPVSNEKAEKLRWMVNRQSPQLLKVAAWTTEILHEHAGGKVVGFLMPSVKAKEIHELYSPKSRRTHFPEADWRFLIHAAKNIARAFNNVHEEGHVIGDVNHGNCVVLPDGTVKLIDCDSYSIHANGVIYSCEVGITTHIPPELQGQSLRGVIRRQEHDNFGLAVIIFQLLFLGRHPFSGKPLGRDEKSLEDCIREHRFAYGAGATSRQIQPPPGVPTLESVSMPVADLFERAFLTRDKRPTPREWVDGLENLSRNLILCRQNSGHHFLKTLQQCPWCEVERQTGNPVFPVNYRQQGQSGRFNIITIETLLSSIQMPGNLPAQPEKQSLILPPDPVLVKHQKKGWQILAGLVVAEIAIQIILIIFTGIAAALIVGLAFAFIAYRVLDKNAPQIKKDVIARFNQSRLIWDKFQNEWKLRDSNHNLLNEAATIRHKITEYKNLPQLRLQKLKQLEEQIYDRQLEDYLDNFRIDEANIKGIGWGRTITLQSYGIETAADVDISRILSIPGFGPTYTQKLTIWKDNLISRFKFDPRKGVSQHDKQKVENEIITTRLQLEQTLQNQVIQLRAKAANINGKNQYLLNKARELSQTLAQAESNRNAISSFSFGVIVMFSIAVGVPTGTGIVKLALTPPVPIAANNVNTSPTPPPQAAINSPYVVNTNVSAANNSNLSNLYSNVNQNVTNTSDIPNIDINSLTHIERLDKAKEYYEQGIEFTKSNNYVKAEKFYREAIRFDDSKASYHHELGYALYRLRKYQDSVSALQKAINLDSLNDNTKEILGLNYIELKKWTEAQKIFSDLTRTNYNSFPIYYNLGIAARNTGDNYAAVTALQKAVQIKPNDARAHYEMGRCYIKLGQISAVDAQYQILLTLNPKLAEQLKQEAENP